MKCNILATFTVGRNRKVFLSGYLTHARRTPREDNFILPLSDTSLPELYSVVMNVIFPNHSLPMAIKHFIKHTIFRQSVFLKQKVKKKNVIAKYRAEPPIK